MTDFVDADCETLFKLAIEHSPFLRYHEAERFFPILAESWLTMTSRAPWASDPDIVQKTLGDVAADPGPPRPEPAAGVGRRRHGQLIDQQADDDEAGNEQ